MFYRLRRGKTFVSSEYCGGGIIRISLVSRKLRRIITKRYLEMSLIPSAVVIKNYNLMLIFSFRQRKRKEEEDEDLLLCLILQSIKLTVERCCY